MRKRLAPLLMVALLLSACTSGDPGASGTSPLPAGSSGEPTPTSSASASSPAPEGPTAGATESATRSLSPAASTPKGDLSPASPKPRKTASPVEVDEPARTGTGVRVALRSWEPVTIKSGAPGEIAGPGVAITMRVVNNSDERLDLSNVVADLRYGEEQTPAIRSDRAPTVAFSGALSPGEGASATYAFRIDEPDRDVVTLLVSLNTEVPVVVFEGSLK